MPTLAKNVLLNGKVLPKGKNISAANVKKFELGDHLFEKAPAQKPEPESDPKGEPEGDKTEE